MNSPYVVQEEEHPEDEWLTVHVQGGCWFQLCYWHSVNLGEGPVILTGSKHQCAATSSSKQGDGEQHTGGRAMAPVPYVAASFISSSWIVYFRKKILGGGWGEYVLCNSPTFESESNYVCVLLAVKVWDYIYFFSGNKHQELSELADGPSRGRNIISLLTKSSPPTTTVTENRDLRSDSALSQESIQFYKVGRFTPIIPSFFLQVKKREGRKLRQSSHCRQMDKIQRRAGGKTWCI